MIQRIQTVYFLLTSVFSFLFPAGKMMKFADGSGNILYLTVKGLTGIDGTGVAGHPGTVLPLLILPALTGLLGIVTIFLYMKRKTQIRLSLALIILSVFFVAAAGWYAFTLPQKLEATIRLVPGMVYPLLALLFSILALGGIRKDEDMVRSYDRLR